jgi:polyisoprenoid-binding protein YceI
MRNKENTTGAWKNLSMVLLIVLSINAFTQSATAQTPYKVSSGSEISVNGTSNLHDWSMVASAFTCEGSFIIKSGQVQDISSLSFSLPVNNLKSKEKVMDNRAYKALKADEFSKITFKLTQASVSQKTVKAIGNLTIAGVTKEITIQVLADLTNDGVLTLKGSKLIKMSDYNMKAPVFMMGALKTGNEVTINISLKLNKSSLTAQAN